MDIEIATIVPVHNTPYIVISVIKVGEGKISPLLIATLYAHQKLNENRRS